MSEEATEHPAVTEMKRMKAAVAAIPDFDRVNIKWRLWYAEQSNAVKDDILACHAFIAKHEDIAHEHYTGWHARMVRLLQYCAEAHGYVIS